MAVEWTVEYSRFFNFPSPSSYSFYSLDLKLLPPCKSRSGGNWIVSSFAAVLRIVKLHSNDVPILSVSINGEIYEEHFLSNLNFSWPQVSCTSDCPARSSRVVFLSFSDFSGKIQKFAVRFSACNEVQTFLNTVKESLRETLDGGGNNIIFEDPSPCEIISSIQHRVDAESVPALTFNDDNTENPLQPLLSNNIETIFSGMPPSFTELLTNCSNESEGQSKITKVCDLTAQSETQVLDSSPNGQSKITEVCDLTAQSGTHFLDSSPNVFLTEVANALKQPAMETSLSSEIVKYMSNSSFHDMLARIEGVISELGGDMVL